MRELLAVLVMASVPLGLWFLVRFGRPWRNTASRPTAWLLSTWTLVSVALQMLLVFVMLRVRFPIELAIAVVAAQDGVWIWWLVRLYRSRHDLVS